MGPYKTHASWRYGRRRGCLELGKSDAGGDTNEPNRTEPPFAPASMMLPGGGGRPRQCITQWTGQPVGKIAISDEPGSATARNSGGRGRGRGQPLPAAAGESAKTSPLRGKRQTGAHRCYPSPPPGNRQTQKAWRQRTIPPPNPALSSITNEKRTFPHGGVMFAIGHEEADRVPRDLDGETKSIHP